MSPRDKSIYTNCSCIVPGVLAAFGDLYGVIKALVPPIILHIDRKAGRQAKEIKLLAWINDPDHRFITETTLNTVLQY
jgi:hypothetical protein